MEYKLFISNKAHEDLDDILFYISHVLFATEAATRLANAVKECYDYLQSNPYMYSTANIAELAEKEYRRAVVNNYIIVYKVDETAKAVIIHRIFYGGQDYAALI